MASKDALSRCTSATHEQIPCQVSCLILELTPKVGKSMWLRCYSYLGCSSMDVRFQHLMKLQMSTFAGISQAMAMSGSKLPPSSILSRNSNNMLQISKKAISLPIFLDFFLQLWQLCFPELLRYEMVSECSAPYVHFLILINCAIQSQKLKVFHFFFERPVQVFGFFIFSSFLNSSICASHLFRSIFPTTLE